jgi:glycosyltransferase involved in cell wall biosynthesis
VTAGERSHCRAGHGAPVICTIIASNYLPQARVLADSLADHLPGQRLQALLIDDPAGAVDETRERFDVLSPGDLVLAPSQFAEMRAYYDVTELATSLKPSLLLTLLDRHTPRSVLYLDPDMEAFSSLQALATLGDEHAITLTPHAAKPMPRDEKQPSELDILASGVWNLGFLLVSEGAKPFLHWWAEHLRFDALIDHGNMLFTDQRWVDLAVGCFDIHALRDPAYNVAYWNLDHRELELVEDRYRVDGSPLALFHFSGFRAERPQLLSKFQGTRPRMLLSEHPVLRQLCREYADLLYAAGYEESLIRPYGWGRLPDGTEMTAAMRAAIRRALRDHTLGIETERPPDPFDPSLTAAFHRWLAAPEPARVAAPEIPRLFYEFHQRRLDLKLAFPHLDSFHADRFLAWARTFAPREEVIPDAVGRVAFAAGPPPARPELRWAGRDALYPGVLVSGYLDSELGLGEGARRTLSVMEEAGIPCGGYAFGETRSPRRPPGALAATPPPDLNTNAVCVNADQLPRFAQEVGEAFFDGRYTIGYWAWETESPTEAMVQSAQRVDEIWTVSEFSRRAIQAGTDRPVLKFTPPIIKPAVGSGRDPRELGIPDGFVFLFMFDCFSTLARKNPLGLIEAFCRAFRPNQGPKLVLKSINGDQRPLDMETLRVATCDRNDIVLIDGCLSESDCATMLARADCYVSLHRAEGFGLTMADAVALGIPLIATGYSGNLEFMDDETAYLVPAARTRVGPGAEPYPADHVWGEPDLDVAAELMNRVHASPGEAAARAQAASRELLARHGPAQSARFLISQFERIQDLLASG